MTGTGGTDNPTTQQTIDNHSLFISFWLEITDNNPVFSLRTLEITAPVRLCQASQAGTV